MIRHTISMPETMSHHVMELVDKGHYGCISDYLRDLIGKDLKHRKAMQQQAETLKLKTLIEAGKASGIGGKSMAEIKAEARAELGL